MYIDVIASESSVVFIHSVLCIITPQGRNRANAGVLVSLWWGIKAGLRPFHIAAFELN